MSITGYVLSYIEAKEELHKASRKFGSRHQDIINYVLKELNIEIGKTYQVFKKKAKMPFEFKVTSVDMVVDDLKVILGVRGNRVKKGLEGTFTQLPVYGSENIYTLKLKDEETTSNGATTPQLNFEG